MRRFVFGTLCVTGALGVLAVLVAGSPASLTQSGVGTGSRPLP
jgi:hypothetical protein